MASMLTERYGRRPGGRRRLSLVAAALALLAGVVWAGWVAASTARRPVHWAQVGYSLRSDSVTVVSFDVRTRAGVDAVCTVRAVNGSGTEVGLIDVPVADTSGSTVRITASVPTSEPAVAGGVKACAATR